MFNNYQIHNLIKIFLGFGAFCVLSKDYDIIALEFSTTSILKLS